ncbi:phosphatidylinositol-binding protein scs2 [Gryganskiella cystojenkinii]|nr:phosphatidylinositol-binding protein scs2 [Gryganskiella cystojenkinii]
MSIELDPSSQLSFRRPLTEPIKETLLIRNPTQLPIAFKVKTTAPKQYCVRPNSGRIEPNAELEVQVQMQAMREEPPVDFKCKDKFLVQSVAITAEREHLSAQDLWPTIERESKDQIREKKIRCVFLPPLEHEIHQIKEEEAETGSQHSSTSHNTYSANTVPAPASPIQSVSSSAPAPSISVSGDSNDVVSMKRELESAQERIQSLQSMLHKVESEASTLRQRKPESSGSSAPTMTAVHLKHQQQEGYPITYVVGAALIAFIFAYLFF